MPMPIPTAGEEVILLSETFSSDHNLLHEHHRFQLRSSDKDEVRAFEKGLGKIALGVLDGGDELRAIDRQRSGMVGKDDPT